MPRKDVNFDEKAPWWSGGLYFSCASCGTCCGCEPGTVSFTSDEESVMARSLGINIAEFRSLYVWTKHGAPSLRELANLDCVFLERNANLCWCRIYEARPAQCRTFPFWADALRSRFSWDRFASSCPGMNRGVFFDRYEIAERLSKSPL
ncbi:MAG: YkgJ family cysteine cluster protein [Synergistaceae bacterium]|jgi:Fe-S-cluster containining protein|nr:YkgJ family cysteine cluster protein [Synergistaceae bacterium]